MLVFDEKKYAEKLLKDKKFQTYRQKDIERYILIRYLHEKGLNNDEIRQKLDKFPLIGCEYLDKKDIDLIYERIFQRALSCPLVTNVEIKIYKEEIDAINSLDDNFAQDLLFVLLVYYKWAINQNYLYFFSKHNNVKMVMTNDVDIWKYANIMKLRVSERHQLSNKLILNNLYIEDNFKSYNYFYLPFIKNDGDVAFTINNYDNILGELHIYNNPDDYKRCSNCKVVIKKTRSPKKYCNNCAKLIKNKQYKKYYKNKI